MWRITRDYLIIKKKETGSEGNFIVFYINASVTGKREPA
jgi:hypothetical protein